MSIQYAGGSIVNNTYATGTTTPASDMESALITALVSAGWASTPVAASDVLTFAGQPSAADTVTLDSSPNNKTYTFRASVSTTANEVLIGATAADTIVNLVAAINAGAGSGTKYGSLTTAHVTMTASGSTATTLTVSYRTTGSAGNTAPVSKSAANLSWAASTLLGGKTALLSAITPHGLQCKLTISTAAGSFYTPGTTLNVLIGDRYGANSTANLATGNPTSPSVSTNFRIVANKYQFFQMRTGSTNNQGAGNFMAGGVPWLPSVLAPININTATNATPIVCNTVAAHNLVTGRSVKIVGGLGNLAVNGVFVVTVIDPNNFSLDTSVGTGAYTAGSAYFADVTLQNRLVECIWATASDGGNTGSMRTSIFAIWDYTSLNGQVRGNDNSAATLQLLNPNSVRTGQSATQWYNNEFVIVEPVIFAGVSNGAVARAVGQLWDCAVVKKDITLEQAATFDSHNFLAIGIDSVNIASVLVAVT